MTERKVKDLPVSIAEQLEKDKQSIKDKIGGPMVTKLKAAGQFFQLPSSDMVDSVECVVVDFTTIYRFYDRPYNKDNPSAPACAAVGDNPKNMVPLDESPVKQHPTCTGCPQDEFGRNGNKGKHCKNERCLALIPLDDIERGDPVAPIWIYGVSPSSIKFFDAYVSRLAIEEKLPIQVVTQLFMDRSLTYSAPRFKVSRDLTEEELALVFNRRTEARNLLSTPISFDGYVPLSK